jgi:hypothetical protein
MAGSISRRSAIHYARQQLPTLLEKQKKIEKKKIVITFFPYFFGVLSHFVKDYFLNSLHVKHKTFGVMH